MTERSGGCLSGRVRYIVRGETYRFGLFHCADCRKESGSVLVAYAEVGPIIPNTWTKPIA